MMLVTLKNFYVSDYNILSNKPRYPKYADKAVRQKSYKYFMSSSPVDTDTLCQSGFFFTGPYDWVVCFWCGGDLKDFWPSHDTWQTHARYGWYNFTEVPRLIYLLNTTVTDRCTTARNICTYAICNMQYLCNMQYMHSLQIFRLKCIKMFNQSGTW